MKKKIGFVLSIVLIGVLCVGGFSGCTARNKTLKIYNWGEYMDPEVIGMFEDWYMEEYGEKIKVKPDYFEANEDVLHAIESKKDFDLVCPSDYMIDRMQKMNLLKPIDKTVIDIAEENLLSDMLLEILDTIDPGATYSVPYVWGTFGIMYNTKYIDTPEKQAKMHSWEALWDDEFSGMIDMKKQPRDSYAVASIYANREKLSSLSNNFIEYGTEYKAYLNKLFQKFEKSDFDADDFSGKDPMKAVEEALIAQKPLLKKYESDNGKMDMAEDNADSGKLGLYWSCDAGFVMNNFERNGIEIKGNHDLRYVVPDEGSNIWVDGWVIPKYAKNEVAANRFLKFLCTPEIARLNAEYAGAQTCNKDEMARMKADLEKDTEFFGEGESEFKTMYLEMFFPSDETLKRCAVMSDFGSRYPDSLKMFNNLVGE